MFAAPFEYYRAASVDEAGRLLQDHPGAKLIAGGHSLVPLLKMRLAAPTALVDIGRIEELKGIVDGDTHVRIGALTTHAELAVSTLLGSVCPLMCEAAARIGDQQVRNCGTIGGNLAHADPASDLPTVLMALDARMRIAGRGRERAVPIGEFLRGMMVTSLGEHEILTAIEVPKSGPGHGTAYVKFSHPASHYAVLGAAAVVALKDGTCTDARVAVGGLLPAARRLPSVEQALVGQHITAEHVTQATARVGADLGTDVMGDIYASAEYRAAMAPVYVGRALRSAFERAA